MEKQNEKQPVDDLFARRLKTMSLPPGPDAFERLQARMGKADSRKRIVFWSRSTSYQYMAIAACLLLTCLFDWLYLSALTPTSTEEVVAVNKETALAETSLEPKRRALDSVKLKLAVVASDKPGKRTDSRQVNDSRLIAKVGRSVNEKTLSRSAPNAVPPTQTDQFAKTELDAYSVETVTGSDEKTVATVNNPVPTAERVLVVTIAEPEVLSAAHRTTAMTTDQKIATASTIDKPGEEGKTVSFWQHMKRLKQGEIFARKDIANDERGLLGRAYSGLKQSLDKDKSIKQ